jgi:heme/copper-type cytochrome/quinol oxidase subunit 3
MIAVVNGNKSGFRPPPRASSIGMWLVLATLGMLFVSSMLLYALMRLHVFGRISNQAISIPIGAWGSTVIILAGSVTIHLAVSAIRRERREACLKYLHITSAIAVLFLIVQTPCMIEIVQEHRAIAKQVMSTQIPGEVAPVSLYGLVFVLILLHAMHVIGGVVALVVVTLRARKGRYDHENYQGVQFAARYWHFLDLVWLTMFTMFLVLG